jgi:alpha-beta hydrolase superfamily lysophospholipase
MTASAGEIAQESSTVREQGPLTRQAGSAGPSLYFYTTFPRTKPKAVVGVIHGYGEHGERYLHVADAWAEKGIASVGIDLRGHGRAQGRRGHCDRFAEFLDDAAELARLVEKRAGGAPTVLFGHSFGGLIAVSYVLATSAPAWRGLMLSAPYLGLAIPVPPLKAAAGRLASKVLPTFALPMGFGGADVTRDAERAAAYDKDPLTFQKLTVRWFTEAEAAQKRALAGAASLTLPLYLVMGTQDRLAKLSTARAFFGMAGSQDKTMVVKEGGFHESLSDPEWRETADAMATWILAHTS